MLNTFKDIITHCLEEHREIQHTTKPECGPSEQYTRQCGAVTINPFHYFSHNAMYHLTSKPECNTFLKFIKKYNQPDFSDST